MLVHDFLDYYARNTPDAPCLTQGDNTLAYGEIRALSNRFANGLLTLGIGKGDRIAILGENGAEHLLLFMAASKTGAVAVPLNYRLAPAELAYMIRDAGIQVLLVLRGMESVLGALRDQLPDGITLLAHGQPNSLDWDHWISQFPLDTPKLAMDKDDAFIQLYTSGTTGNPKGVVLSHYNVISLAMMNDTATPYRSNAGSASIVCAPMFHIGGAGSVVLGIWSGQHILLHKTFDPEQVVSDLERYRTNTIFLVPAMIMAILQLPDLAERDFSKLKQVFYGASPISETLLRQAMEAFRCDFVQMYGMTETTGTVVNLSPEDHREALAGNPELLRSAGRPSVGVQARVVDSEGVDVPVGEVGEIWIKSDTNMLGYHNLPDATASSLTDGWLHTGDAGSMDDRGYLYLKDRIKDMVVSGGENIYPVEVENALAKHDAVADVAVIGIPDEKFGEALLAFVVTKSGATLTLEELVDFCRDKIAGYKIPRQMEMLDALPRNPAGKILKKVLREPYWRGQGRGVG